MSQDNVLQQQIVRLATRIYWLARSWYWRSRFVESMHKSLKRRAEVESLLFDCAAEKRPLPTRAECWELAMKLGTRE